MRRPDAGGAGQARRGCVLAHGSLNCLSSHWCCNQMSAMQHLQLAFEMWKSAGWPPCGSGTSRRQSFLLRHPVHACIVHSFASYFEFIFCKRGREAPAWITSRPTLSFRP